MRASALALVALLAMPLALAHEGPHGLDLRDLRLAFRPLEAGQEFSFTLVNDVGAATNVKARITLVGTAVREEFALPDIASGASVGVTLVAPLRASGYGCAQAVAYLKATDLVCAFTDGVVLP